MNPIFTPEIINFLHHKTGDTHWIFIPDKEDDDMGRFVVGYCLGFIHHTFYANGMFAWLEEITVSSLHRKCGIGAKLMASFESWAKDEGAVLSALATRRAAPFYSAIGYDESAVYFRKLLSAL